VADERGIRSLLVDTDPQGNLTSSFMSEPDGKPGVERLFDPQVEPDAVSLVRRTAFAHLDIIPAFPSLSNVDESKQSRWEKSDLHLSLREGLEPLRNQYDLIIIDCPPRVSLVSIAALTAADGLIIPLEPADYGAQGVSQVTEAYEHVRSRYNPNLHLLGYLASRFKPWRSVHVGYRKQLSAMYGPLAFETSIRDLAPYERSVSNRIPVTAGDPRSNAALTARRFFDEVIERAERCRAPGNGLGGKVVRHEAVAATR
jgi:chromosome partitioning protein